jgi:hypothetical protein
MLSMKLVLLLVKKKEKKKEKKLVVPCIAILQVVCNHLKQMTCCFKPPNNQTGSC